jgi:hypothetical protein
MARLLHGTVGTTYGTVKSVLCPARYKVSAGRLLSLIFLARSWPIIVSKRSWKDRTHGPRTTASCAANAMRQLTPPVSRWRDRYLEGTCDQRRGSDLKQVDEVRLLSQPGQLAKKLWFGSLNGHTIRVRPRAQPSIHGASSSSLQKQELASRRAKSTKSASRRPHVEPFVPHIRMHQAGCVTMGILS